MLREVVLALAFPTNIRVKFGLHYGDYRSKLVPFEEQNNIFCILKKAPA
jgi:hypothetical protein